MPYALEPFDPLCGRYARDMGELDPCWSESQEHLDEHSEGERQIERADHVRFKNETFDRKTGHFTCDKCSTRKDGLKSGT